MKFSILAVSLSLLGAQARAAVVFYEHDQEIRAKTIELLAEKNLNYREMAQERLKGTGHFDRQRVEISGMLVADDTRRIDPGDFDDYIKPSVNADKKRTIGDWGRSWGGYKPDVAEMEKSMRGEMTAHTIKTVAAYKNMEINEIVAHSWGSELIYAAILNGEMRPPKKLIVLGVPDDDRAKWSLLAARTGTQVFWGRADNDAAALDKGVKLAKEAAKDVDFEAKWAAACADKEKRICLPYGRRPQPVVNIPVGNLPARFPFYLAHDRADYYDRVRKDYFKGTAQQLLVADNKRVVREMKKLEQETVNAIHEEARSLVEAARAQIAIARRDHDNRLKGMMIDIAVRACTAPERVNQAELDALPEPNDADFVNIGPDIADDCIIWVYRDLRRGVDLMSIRNRAASFAEPVAARPIPPSPVDTGRRVTNFLFMLPGVKDFAVAACRSPGQVAIPDDVTRPYGDIRFIPTEDDRETVRLSSGLGVCEARLFHRLVELIRGGYGPRIDTQWVIGAVRAYTPAPSYSDPTPQHYTPPPSHGDPCRDNGNIRCP